MDDLISRQAAIDAADRADYAGLAVEDVKKVTDEVIKEIKKLPPAPPNLRPTCDQLAIDCISRQAAIDAILGATIFDSERSLREYTQKTGGDKWCEGVIEAMDAVTEVPSVQPDLAQLLAYECGKASAQPEIKPIGYNDCSNAMMKMWMDNVVTDGEYNRIMDKLNAYWRAKDE